MLIPASARELLAREPPSGIGWAAFDPDWYVARYRDALPRPADADGAAVLRFYLDEGVRRRHSPNRFFDERWYIDRHPDVAAAVASGAFESGFDHYCRAGHAGHAPHWLFDEASYRARYVDLTGPALAEAGFANGYDHYLRRGDAENRSGHKLFDPAVYRAALPQAAGAGLERLGPYAHFLLGLDEGADEVRASLYFDPEFYRARYPEAAAAIAAGEWRASLEHYLGNAKATEFDPLALFSEQFYLKRYPDIAAAVGPGRLRNGYSHFLSNGARELRTPHPSVDLAWYMDAHKMARADLAAGRAADAFSHYLEFGQALGFAIAPPRDELVAEPAGKSLFRLRARNLLPLWGRAPLDFDPAGPPALSVVLVLHDQFALTMMALASLRANFAGPIELILVDSGSTDETTQITRYVRGARLLRFDGNIGFVRGCNAALYSVTAPCVLFLNNDVELGPGAVAAALRRLHSEERIGAVGGKVVRSHGVLQEAGSIVWRNGATAGYMRDAPPSAPEVNFARDVDYCSGVFLLVRAAVLAELDGFDDAFAPAYYEDADLCVRVARAGYRVVYDPGVLVHHLEYGSAATRAVSEAEIARGQAVFVARHADWLQSRPPPGDALRAREAGVRRRVLFIEDRLPLRALGSGFVRSNDIVASIAALGWSVTVFPVRAFETDPAAVFADFPDTVEVMHDRDLGGLPAFLADREGHYETIWIARTHNLARVSPAWGTQRPRLVVDTEALATERDARRAALPEVKARRDRKAALRREFADVDPADTLVAVSAAEAAALRGLGFSRVHVLGHRRALAPTPRSWGDRDGLLFVGAIHEPGAPNLDGLAWFIDDVLPIVERALGWQTRLTVVGYLGEGVSLDRFASHPRVTLRGMVADTVPLYDQHRVFVAPTRFAAGMPYKVHEAASFGLPVVATALLAEQLGWSDGEELLAASGADPARYAEQVLRLYGSEPLWRQVREAALARVARENAAESYEQALRAILG